MQRRKVVGSLILPAAIFVVLTIVADLWLVPGVSADPATAPVSERRPAVAFEDVTRGNGLPISKTPTWGSLWVDHERDGLVELIINRHLRRAYLFENSPTGYREEEEPAFEEHAPGRKYYDRHACAWGEANGDGMPDLYCVSGAQKGQGVGPNQLLIQTSHGLVDRAAEYGVRDAEGRGRTVNWLDYDDDGDLDIFVGNERRSGSPNVMFRNDNGSFTPVDVGVGEELGTSNSTWADWDNDGDPDLMVFAHGVRGAQVYRNDSGRFVPTTVNGVSGKGWDSAAWADYDGDGWIDLHLVSRWRSLILRNVRGSFAAKYERPLVSGRMSTWLDVENDGDLDLFIVSGAPRHRWRYEGNHADILLKQEEGAFREVVRGELRGPMDGSGDSVAAADYDGDGATDLFVTNGYLDEKGRVQLMRNVSRMQNWAGVMLLGDPADPFGYGAKIHLVSETLDYHRAQTDNFNYKVQAASGYVHLGLAADVAARVRITWADGTEDCGRVVDGVVLSVAKGTLPCLP